VSLSTLKANILTHLLGWHASCLKVDLPDGAWHCPECPAPPALDIPQEPLYDDMVVEIEQPGHNHTHYNRGQSVASSSRSIVYPAKANVLSVTSAPTDESDMEVDVDTTLPSVTPRPQKRKSIRPKTKARPRQETATIYTPSPITQRSQRVRGRPVSPPSSPPKIRLRLPGRGRQEEEKGIFDDILTAEDRDTSKTTVTNGDKQKFDNSRRTAEVSVVLDRL
jgi:hypothetical protein